MIPDPPSRGLVVTLAAWCVHTGAWMVDLGVAVWTRHRETPTVEQPWQE